MNTFAIRIRNGFTIHVPASLAVTTSYVLLEQEAWFEDELEFVRRCVRPGEHAVDVGANFGLYTTALADAVGSDGRVYAFEPASQTAALLNSTISLRHSRQVKVFPMAVSDTKGRATLHFGSTPELNSIGSSVPSGASSESVEVVALDQCLGDQPQAIFSFIKIDAEGHELKVGLGARNTLRRHEPLVMFEVKHSNTLDLAVLDFLESLGFAPFRLAPGLGVLVPFYRSEPVDSYQLNLFACSPGRAAELARRGLLATQFDLSTVDAGTGRPDWDACADVIHPVNRSVVPPGAYRRCIDEYVLAQSLVLDPNRRLAHLQDAFEWAKIASAERRSIARLATLARSALDLGHRDVTVKTLGAMADGLVKSAFPAMDEPGLAPCRDLVSPDGRKASASNLPLAVLESFERVRSFSSSFVGPAALPYLDQICGHAGASAEMHRRRQLLRLRAGLQPRPEPHPLLVVESAHNRNPWFWSGQR